jgi:peptide/nickel transport system ATP-binding protein
MRQVILAVMRRIHDERGTAYLFITHDLGLARYFAQDGRVAVMYAGHVVEYGPTEDVIQSPRHPYTAALREAVPDPDPTVVRPPLTSLMRSTELPDLTRPAAGCPYHPRCAYALPVCRAEAPALAAVGGGATWAACHRADELDLTAGDAAPSASGSG